MRISELFGRTLRESPADAQMTSHQLIIRAGLAHPISAGIYALMPLGWRVFRKIAAIMREEMEAIGGQEMLMPVLNPAELWAATGRLEGFGRVLQRFKNFDGREFVLATTHEEIMADLALHEIESHRQLPKLLFHIQTKVRDEARPRGGLIRLREFTMKDAYSLDADAEGMAASYERVYAAYLNIFTRAGLSDVIPVEADTGAMGGSRSEEFVIAHPEGEDRFVQCDSCGYAANVEAADFVIPPGTEAEPVPMEKIATPNCETIADVADFAGVPTAQTLKAVFYIHESGGAEDFVFAVVRGDLEINETRLINALGGGELRPATVEEIAAVGGAAGYASPAGLNVRAPGSDEDVRVIADRSIKDGANFVVGANDPGYHYINANYPRDFAVTEIAAIAEARDGATCGRCSEGALHVRSAIELGHCFQLGTRYSDPIGITYSDADGERRPVLMGSYGIGIERMMAAIIERHHDDDGIIWPVSVAPFPVYLLTIGKSEEVAARAEALYNDLSAAGVEVLFDDRGERAGVKFADADLIGAPLRITLSSRTLEASEVEIKWRHESERSRLPLEGLPEHVRAMLLKTYLKI
jgi:prolyl-tRNA synthetase